MARKRSQDPEQGKRQAHVQRSMRANIFDGEQVVLVAHRPQGGMWWLNDYAFQWDVDLSAKLKPGKNSISLRINNPHHMGGMFRRPFLYTPTGS